MNQKLKPKHVVLYEERLRRRYKVDEYAFLIKTVTEIKRSNKLFFIVKIQTNIKWFTWPALGQEVQEGLSWKATVTNVTQLKLKKTSLRYPSYFPDLNSNVQVFLLYIINTL